MIINNYIGKQPFPAPSYLNRGSIRRVCKSFKPKWKKHLAERNAWRAAPVEQSVIDHVGKPIEVTTYYFDMTDDQQMKTMIRVGTLTAIDTKSKYADWEISGIKQPPVSLMNIKILEENTYPI